MRPAGIEPASRVWKTLILPLNYGRWGVHSGVDIVREHNPLNYGRCCFRLDTIRPLNV